MEETSGGAPEPSPPADAEAECSTRRTTKPGTKRLFVTFSVLLSFLLGLPFLLKSTEIYRSPLPFHSIDSLSAQLQSEPPSLPCRFQAVFLRSSHRIPEPALADRIGFLIAEDMRRRTGNDPLCGGCGRNFSISVTIDSGAECARSRFGSGKACLWRCGEVGFDGLGGGDEVVDELLDSALKGRGECLEGGSGKVYTVVVMEREDDEEEEAVRVVVGKHRHAWMMGKVSETDAVLMIGKIFVNFFMNGGKEEGEVGKAEFVPVGLDGSVVLSFSLLNADPSDWVFAWEFQKIEKILLSHLVEALAPIANISVESQVLYHTPKSSISYWDDKLGSYIFSTKDLPFFVNSNEWHLDTSTAAAGRSKVLQFVVYVPSARECPLLLRLPDGDLSKTNGFISPMWGGVVVWNPPNCSDVSRRAHITRSTIQSQELQKIFQVFIGQIRLLFGLRASVDSTEGITNVLASERGFAEWELDLLYRHHACFNLLSCVTTLESLSKLVQSLPRMIVMDEIGKQVKFSLEAASLAQQNASLGEYDASAVSSRQARALAENAFFHPSIMSISYSSIEHYFAIYMPFFAPVSLHVFLAAIKELKRYKIERTKYKTFLADKTKVS